MMMKALSAGGLEPVFSVERESINSLSNDGDYHLNKGGLFELKKDEYRQPDFPDNCNGKLVKFLCGGMLTLRPSDNIKHIVFMRRNIKEIARSCAAAFGNRSPHIIPELDSRLDRIESILEKRIDVRLTRMRYNDIITNPQSQFNRLCEDGWPVDPAKCALIVDPEQYRHRHEGI